MPCLRRIRWWAAVLLAWAVSAGAEEVTFDVQPRLLQLGETAQATITFHGVTHAPNIEFPQIPGLQITGTGQQMQFGSGGSRVVLSYHLLPQRSGSFTIGPYTLEYAGRTIELPAITLDVRPRSEADRGGDLVFARLGLPDKPPYLHETFDLELKVYFLPHVELAREVNLLGGFPESGFVLGNFEELQLAREEFNGQLYNVRRFRAKARALTSGVFTLQPVLRVGIVDPQSRRRRDPFAGFFDDPFFRGPSATPVQLTIPPSRLNIRPIPEEGRPVDFAGAVGQFELAVDVRPRELKVGEPITVTIRLSGIGNIADVLPPSFRDSETFKAYEARQVGDSPALTAGSGVKTFEQVVIPRSEKLTELPALQASYFDPRSGDFRRMSAGPFPLQVHPAEGGANALLLQTIHGDSPGGKALILGQDIVYLKTAPARWRHSDGPAVPPAVVWGIHALPPVALAILFWTTRRRRRLEADIALARRQKAPQSARANLRRAEEALSRGAPAAEIFSHLAAAVTDYFCHRLNLPTGAVDGGLILQKLRAAGVPETMLLRWQEFFSISEEVRFAPATPLSPSELETWLDTVASLLRRAERTRL